MFEMSFASMVVVLVVIIWVKGGLKKAGDETKEVFQATTNTALIAVRMAEETTANYANELSLYFLKNLLENAESYELMAKYQVTQVLIRRHMEGKTTPAEAKRINSLVTEGAALLKS